MLWAAILPRVLLRRRWKPCLVLVVVGGKVVRGDATRPVDGGGASVMSGQGPG
jgi:hypothetical protein